MNLSNISPQVWATFEARWPGAANFLRTESLRGELDALKAEVRSRDLDPRRRKWATARIAELDQFFSDQARNLVSNQAEARP